MTVLPKAALIDQIKDLTELELDSLLQEIGQHLFRNNLEHLIDNAFQMDDQTEEIESLEEEVQELENERDELKGSLLDIFHLCTGAEDTEDVEELKSIINKITEKTT